MNIQKAKMSYQTNYYTWYLYKLSTRNCLHGGKYCGPAFKCLKELTLKWFPSRL